MYSEFTFGTDGDGLQVLVKPLLVAIWTVKPVSLFELSNQLSVMDVCVAPVVVGFDGAAGTVAGEVVTARVS